MIVPCPSCGGDIAEDANFCPYCGSHLGSAPGPVHQPVPSRRPAATEAAPTERIGRLVPGSGPALRTCPRCGSTNSVARLRCGRCGADLRTGGVGAPAGGDAGPGGTDPGGAAGGRSRALAVTLIVAAVLGTVLGLAAWVRIGRPADQGAVFDPAVYPGHAQPLDVRSVSVTGADPDDGSTADAMVDGDADTAWTARAEDPSAPPVISVRFPEPVWLDSLHLLAPGTEGAGAVTRLLVATDRGSVFDVALPDPTAVQAVQLPAPVLTRTVTLTATETSGVQGPFAVAEARPLGWPAVGADRRR